LMISGSRWPKAVAKSCGQKLWRTYPVYTSRNTSCGELSNKYIGLIPFLSAFGPFILSSVCDAEFPSFLSEIKNLP
jgi:hypothetical protein